MRRSFSSPLYRRPRILLSVAIFIVALSVRLIPMGRYVTPDEPIWVMRSLRFLDAVRARSWFEIPQTGHPGLTTMALGAVGIRMAEGLDPAGVSERLRWLRNLAWLAPENAEAIRHLAALLPAGRVLMAVTQSVGLLVIYGLGCNRLTERTARWLAVFLALDPFLIGHAGLLHTDALQATLVLLAVLLAMPPAAGRSRGLMGLTANSERWVSMVLSGLCLVLAGLTKLLGLLVAPGLALALVLWGRPQGIRRWLLVALLACSAIGFGFALYPPFWTDPRAAAEVLLNAVRYHEGLGLRDTFFASRMTSDPGPLFYPVVMLFRATPLVLVGLILGIKRRRQPAVQAGWFLVPALGYLAAVTVATKKFDRYALTPLMLLTAVAAVHWTRTRVGQWGRQALIAGLLLPWAVTALLPLHYADPLLGGPWAARMMIPLGWGEGTGFAAGEAAQDFEEDDTLLVENVPGAAPFFPGSVRSLSSTPVRCGDAVVAGPAYADPGWIRRDTVRVAGLPLAGVYAPEETDLPGAGPYLLPGPLPGFEEGPHEFFVAPMTDTLHLHRWLSDTLGDARELTWVRAPGCYPLTDAQITMLIESESDAFDCAPMAGASRFGTDHCRVRALDGEPAPWLARFSQGLDLVTFAVPDFVRAPDPLAVRLRWQPQVPLEDVELYLALRDPETGLVVSEGGRAALSEYGWRSSAWPLHQVVDTEAYVPIPPSLPPAEYQVVLRVTGTDGGWLGFTRPGGDFGGTERPLGRVEVLPPSTSAGAQRLPVDVGVAISGVEILSAGLDEETVWAGSPLPFRLEVRRTAKDIPPSLSWALVCGGETRDGGDLRWSSGDLRRWPEGFRFELRYAPQLDPTLEDSTCDLWLMPQSSAAVAIGEVTVLGRERRFSLPGSPQLSIEAELGDFGQLVGADVSGDTIHAGEALTATLYWQARGGAARDYTVFVHLVDENGVVWAQSDAKPAGGQAPTRSWIAGQVVVDRHVLTLPDVMPAGTYTLWTGMYAPDSGDRVPLVQEGVRLPDDRIRLEALSLR